jgi:hypothetical protein
MRLGHAAGVDDFFVKKIGGFLVVIENRRSPLQKSKAERAPRRQRSVADRENTQW